MPWRTPPPNTRPELVDTHEFFFPKEWWMENNQVQMVTSEQLNEFARQYMRTRFLDAWELDSADVSEWLAEQSSLYAKITDEDDIDDLLDTFVNRLDGFVRQAVDEWNERWHAHV